MLGTVLGSDGVVVGWRRGVGIHLSKNGARMAMGTGRVWTGRVV